MYEKLLDIRSAVNQHRLCLIKEVSTKLKKMIKNVPEDNAPEIGTNEQIIDLVERILYLNQLSQAGQGLKF